MNDWLAATEETEPLTKKYQDELIPYDATSKQSSRSIFQFFPSLLSRLLATDEIGEVGLAFSFILPTNAIERGRKIMTESFFWKLKSLLWTEPKIIVKTHAFHKSLKKILWKLVVYFECK